MNNEVIVNINIPDKDIEKLERVKQLLKEIKEIDNNFGLSNVIETNEDTVLLFNCDSLYKKDHIEDMERKLTSMLQHKCVILCNGITLDKAVGVDYAKGRDYTTTTYYDGNGNPVKEETIQYK